MSKVKTMGASPITGKIYQGTLDTQKSCWVGQKKDVTELACRSVAEHLKITKRKVAFGLADGGFIVLQASVVDELPAEFDEIGEAS